MPRFEHLSVLSASHSQSLFDFFLYQVDESSHVDEVGCGVGCGPKPSSSASSVVKMPLWWLLAIQELLVVTEPEHQDNGPKMLGIVKKRCGEACPDIDFASDAAFETAQKFQDKYWKGTEMNDVEKRRRWKTKLNDWQDSSRDPPHCDATP